MREARVKEGVDFLLPKKTTMFENVGDILAVPFFAYMAYYFHYLPNRTYQETALYAFSLAGLIADSFFTINYFRKHGTMKKALATTLYYALCWTGLQQL